MPSYIFVTLETIFFLDQFPNILALISCKCFNIVLEINIHAFSIFKFLNSPLPSIFFFSNSIFGPVNCIHSSLFY